MNAIISASINMGKWQACSQREEHGLVELRPCQDRQDERIHAYFQIIPS